jgi:hypothetical protein
MTSCPRRYILQSWQVLTSALIAEALAPLVVPIFTYIVILKYRLYDIDVLINRTLVYGSLSAILVVLYFGGIVVLQRLFRARAPGAKGRGDIIR